MSDTRRKTKRDHDERLALSQVKREKLDTGRQVRCNSCYLLYDESEMSPDYDDNGRRIGRVCGSCA